MFGCISTRVRRCRCAKLSSRSFFAAVDCFASASIHVSGIVHKVLCSHANIEQLDAGFALMTGASENRRALSAQLQFISCCATVYSMSGLLEPTSIQRCEFLDRSIRCSTHPVAVPCQCGQSRRKRMARKPFKKIARGSMAKSSRFVFAFLQLSLPKPRESRSGAGGFAH